MNTATTILSTLIVAVIGTLSSPAFAVQQQEQTKKTVKHAEKTSKKAQHDGGKQKYEANKQKERTQKHNKKSTQQETKAGYKEGGKKNSAKMNKSNATAQDKQALKEQRKEIQDDYRANREPGQEGAKGEGKPAKKPWWRFWQGNETTQKNP